MINRHILRKHVKSNIFISIVLLLVPAILLNLMLVLSPDKGVLAGMSSMITSISFLLPLIFIIISGNSILAGEISSGAITYVVTSSVSRVQIMITKLLFMFCCVTISFLLNLVLSIPVVFAKFNDGGASTIAKSISVLLLQNYAILMTVSGIVMFFSGYSSKLSLSYIFGAGLSGGFWLLFTFAQYSSQLSFLQYISINKLGDPGLALVNSRSPDLTLKSASHYVPEIIALFAMTAALYIGSVYAFKNRDLPL